MQSQFLSDFEPGNTSELEKMPQRVLLIGAGPSGMSFLYQMDQLRQAGKDVPEVVCYEKQADWGGLWNYTWRTGNEDIFCLMLLLCW